MKKNTKISVILPIYNVENYIEDSLNSLSKQNIKEIEFICINDGSTDNSLEILEEFAKDDDRFIIISQENMGAGVARNKGIELAQGKYIAFLDPDDWLENNALKTLYDFAEEKKSQIVQFNYKEYNDFSGEFNQFLFNRVVQKKYKYDLLKEKKYNWHDLKKGCLCNLNLHVWSHFYNTEFLKTNNIRFAKTRNGEDHLFAIGAKLMANQIDYLNESLYVYRCRGGSLVNSRKYENFCVFENINALSNFLINKNLFLELEKEFNYYKLQVLITFYNQIPFENLSEYENACKNLLDPKDFKYFLKKAKKNKRKFIENIFSLKNKKENGIKSKILVILGIEFVFSPKKGKK